MMTEALGAADGTRKGELLSGLGILVSYDPLTRRARVTCRPKVSESVVSEGGLQPRSLGFVPVHTPADTAEPPGDDEVTIMAEAGDPVVHPPDVHLRVPC
jgi:hypothetical protein